jgi:hypothetical protein
MPPILPKCKRFQVGASPWFANRAIALAMTADVAWGSFGPQKAMQ